MHAYHKYQSGKNCAINCAIQGNGSCMIWKQKIWLAICEFLWSLTNQNAWFVSSFCTELTLFCTVLKKNCTAFNQSEWRNFFMYIIVNYIERNCMYVQANVLVTAVSCSVDVWFLRNNIMSFHCQLVGSVGWAWEVVGSSSGHTNTQGLQNNWEESASFVMTSTNG